MADAKPPTTVELIWSEGLRFGASAGTNAIVVDGDGAAGPSPVQVAAIGLAGCMGADVAAVLAKGRQHLGADSDDFGFHKYRGQGSKIRDLGIRDQWPADEWLLRLQGGSEFNGIGGYARLKV